MFKRVLSIAGVLFFIIGVYYFFSLNGHRQAATDFDDIQKPANPESLVACAQEIQDVSLNKRVLSESENLSLIVGLTNDSSEDCEVQVALHAPDFYTSPMDPTLTAYVPAHRETQIVWALSPRKAGTYQLIVSIGGEARFLGVSVTTNLGLTVRQSQILALLGTILGPLLPFFPWLFERWQKRRASGK